VTLRWWSFAVLPAVHEQLHAEELHRECNTINLWDAKRDSQSRWRRDEHRCCSRSDAMQHLLRLQLQRCSSEKREWQSNSFVVLFHAQAEQSIR
jgi:hypothetical protein